MVAAQGAPAGVVWEETACPLCGASDERELLTVPGEAVGEVYRLVQCRGCALGYLNPRPDAAAMARYYAEDYHAYQGPRRHTIVRALVHRLRRLACAQAFGDPPQPSRWAARVAARLAGPWLRPGRDSLTALPYHGAGRLLDFGCGSGWYAKRMSDRGWAVTAMDFNPDSLARVARRFGVRTLAGTLPHPEVADGSFDVVVMGSSLEHVHRPHEVVGAAVRALAPGGLLVAVTPNFEAAAYRWFGVDWWALDLPRHLLHFTPATLTRLMTMHGLAPVEVRMLPHARWMRQTLANRRRRLWGPTGRRCAVAVSRLRLTASLLTRWTEWTRQGDAMRIIARRPLTPSPLPPGERGRGEGAGELPTAEAA